MAKTNDTSFKPAASPSAMTINLQTRPFATNQSLETEALTEQDELTNVKVTPAENLLEKLISTPSTEPSIQRTPKKHFSSSRNQRIDSAIQTKLNTYDSIEKSEQEVNSSTEAVIEQANTPIYNRVIQRQQDCEEVQFETPILQRQKEDQELQMQTLGQSLSSINTSKTPQALRFSNRHPANPNTIQRKLTPEQIKHANRIRKARGLPPVQEEEAEQLDNVEEINEISDQSNNQPNNPSNNQPNNPVPQPLLTAPQTIQELAEYATASYAYWGTNEDILLDILLYPFEANWFKAKACLTMEKWPSSVPEEVRPTHTVGIKLMQSIVDMRTKKWKEFTDRIKPEFLERMRMYEDQDLQTDVSNALAVPNQGEKPKNLLNIFDSVGSQAVTSDIDLASGGSNSELGVQFVNSKFRLEFVDGKVIPYDPGTVFDINLYASDWIHGEANTTDQGQVRTITPKPEVENMSAEAEKERTKKMEIWSLVKVRRNMSPEEWTDYTDMTLSSITDQSVRGEMEQKLLDADFEYQTFKLRVETKLEQMDAKLKSQEAAFFNGQASAFGSGNAEYQEEAHFTRAANAIYEETLTEVKLLRLQINKLKAQENGAVLNEQEISNLGIQLGNKIAESLTYANEVYATEGAVQHTVLQQGASKKLSKLKEDNQNNPQIQGLSEIKYNLKPELYLQSVNENVGDSLHSINHYKDVPHYAVYRAGKYLARLCDAAQQLLTPPRASQVPFYEDLDLIGKNAVRVKAIKSDNIEGDPESVKQDTFFKDYNESNLSTVRQEIIMFGAKIPQLFNEKKQQDAEQQRLVQEQQRQVQEQQQPVEVPLPNN